MKVYVVTEEPYHENSSLEGVFWTLEEAKAAFPGEWEDVIGYDRISQMTKVTIIPQPDDEHFTDSRYYYIREAEMPVPTDPLRRFAVAVLEGDPVATDAVRDILKS